MTRRQLYYELRRGGWGKQLARGAVGQTDMMGTHDRLLFWFHLLKERA